MGCVHVGRWVGCSLIMLPSLKLGSTPRPHSLLRQVSPRCTGVRGTAAGPSCGRSAASLQAGRTTQTRAGWPSAGSARPAQYTAANKAGEAGWGTSDCGVLTAPAVPLGPPPSRHIHRPAGSTAGAQCPAARNSAYQQRRSHHWAPHHVHDAGSCVINPVVQPYVHKGGRARVFAPRSRWREAFFWEVAKERLQACRSCCRLPGSQHQPPDAPAADHPEHRPLHTCRRLWWRREATPRPHCTWGGWRSR